MSNFGWAESPGITEEEAKLRWDAAHNPHAEKECVAFSVYRAIAHPIPTLLNLVELEVRDPLR